MEPVEEALGIPSSGYEYMKVSSEYSDLESKISEFMDIRNFLIEVANSSNVPEFQGKDKRLQFINYGDTQLVYVLSVGDRKYTMLLGQPATEFGVVRKEYENLKALGKNNKQNVVVPMQYFKDEKDKRELYVTPYLYQARCIGVEEKEWGAWIPEPVYHFKEFSEQERSIINSSMIAMLIKFFDDKNNLGIGACRLGGGDFVLEKEYENEQITYENILKRMKLENEGFNMQKNGTFDIEHIYSKNYNAMKVHYFFIQFAHTIRQLLEKGLKYVKELKMSIKEVSAAITQTLTHKIFNLTEHNKIQLRFDLK